VSPGWPGLCFLRLTWQHTRGSALLGWVKTTPSTCPPDRGRGLRSTLTAAHEVTADQIDLDGDVDDAAGGASTAQRQVCGTADGASPPGGDSCGSCSIRRARHRALGKLDPGPDVHVDDDADDLEQLLRAEVLDERVVETLERRVPIGVGGAGERLRVAERRTLGLE
jgi:hypothetical protein